MSACLSPTEHLAALRAEVSRIERAGPGRDPAPVLPTGVAQVDARLAGGGLAGGALHEVAAASPDWQTDAAATLFLAGLAALKARADEARAQGGIATVLWAVPRRDLFAPGLAQAGLTPDRLLFAECRDDEEVLAVMEDALRHGGLAAVVGEVGRCAMAAGRRLQLAAEEAGVMALMLRRWRRTGSDPLADPSPAMTRWRIAPAPSTPLAVAGVGRGRIRAELVRQRGGDPATWILETPDAEARLAHPAVAADRADPAARRAA